jgi:hypothetical protein
MVLSSALIVVDVWTRDGDAWKLSQLYLSRPDTLKRWPPTALERQLPEVAVEALVPACRQRSRDASRGERLTTRQKRRSIGRRSQRVSALRPAARHVKWPAPILHLPHDTVLCLRWSRTAVIRDKQEAR